MKTWRKTEDIINEFKDAYTDGIFTVDIGIMDVNPQRIIGLNQDFDDIKDDYKMNVLKNNVSKNGWTNENPLSLALLQFPNGDLVVNGGGNHRSVLSNELGLERIKANVSKVIDVNTIPESMKQKLHKLYNQIALLQEVIDNGDGDDQVYKRIESLEIKKINLYREL